MSNIRFVRLKKGMLLKAKKQIKGVSNSYNTPELIIIPEGTIIEVPSQSTRMGDVFCHLMEGTCTLHCRGHYEGETRELKPSKIVFLGHIPMHTIIGLSEGYDMGGGPYALGKIDTNLWEITNVSEEEIMRDSMISSYENETYKIRESKEPLNIYKVTIYKRAIAFLKDNASPLLVGDWIEKMLKNWECPLNAIQ